MRIQRLIAACLVGAAALAVSADAPFEGVPRAEAAVVVAHTLPELVKRSPHVVVAKAVERRSLWEVAAGSKRIVTYTKLEVQDVIYGKPGKTVWVRTLGGAVGRIGQQVAGEARFQLKHRSIVFLFPTADGKTVVTGAAQGHFPLKRPKAKGGPATVKLSRSLGKVLPRRGPSISVQERLMHKRLDDAIADIRAAKTQLDALHKKPQRNNQQQ
jgi:hypothetical protein